MIKATDKKGLGLITNDAFKKVLLPSCTVKLDNDVINYKTFIAFGLNDNQSITVSMHADTLTLGQSLMILSEKFKQALAKESEENQHMILEALKG